MNYHQFKRNFQKLALKLSSALAANKEKRATSEHGKECTAVCSKLLKNPQTTLLISPLSGKRYIRSEGNELFIKQFHNNHCLLRHAFAMPCPSIKQT